MTLEGSQRHVRSRCPSLQIREAPIPQSGSTLVRVSTLELISPECTALSVSCLKLWDMIQQGIDGSSSFLYPYGVLFTKFFGSIQKLFLILKGNSLASDSYSQVFSSSLLYTFPC